MCHFDVIQAYYSDIGFDYQKQLDNLSYLFAENWHIL